MLGKQIGRPVRKSKVLRELQQQQRQSSYLTAIEI